MSLQQIIEALEPFADAMDKIEHRFGSDIPGMQPTIGMTAEFCLIVSNFRDARDALTAARKMQANEPSEGAVEEGAQFLAHWTGYRWGDLCDASDEEEYPDGGKPALRKVARKIIERAIGFPADDWRAIDTAPRDGTPFESRREGEKKTSIRQIMFDPEHHAELEYVDTLTGRTTETHHSYAAPTHWRPLSGALSYALREVERLKSKLHQAQIRHIGTVEHAGAHLCRAERAEEDLTSMQSELTKADSAIQEFGLILGSTDEWVDQDTMIADVRARVTAAKEALAPFIGADIGAMRDVDDWAGKITAALAKAREEERERCAKILTDRANFFRSHRGHEAFANEAETCAADIRKGE